MIPRFDEQEEKNVQEVLRSGKLSEYFKNQFGGPWTQLLEEKLRSYHGVQHALVVSNGTSALQIALQACLNRLYQKPRNEGSKNIVVTPYSFIASASVPLMVRVADGYSPVPHFVDIDAESYTIPPSDPKLATPAPYGAKVIIPVNLLGHPADYEQIYRPDDGFIIEDHAQSIGAKYRGRMCGSLGDISSISFQFTKVITTFGEGGAVLTNDEDLYQRCLSIRSHGSQYLDSPYNTYNFRLSEVHAAFGCAQMDKLNYFLSIQKRNAEYIVEHLPRGLKPPAVKPWAEPSWFLVACKWGEKDGGMTREKFVEKCTEAGVNMNQPGAVVSTGYSNPLYEKPLLKPFKPVGGLRNVEQACRESLWLDLHRWRELESVKEDLEKMNKILET
ncbi:MAG: DegT/DnrJ/EryC1/StrS family aminotransferase [Parcubacteria group bacterium]|nr:DegT/DnrJ/EryC1/StrS family aminotransferase [Parcubacteria group bacterium]